MINFRLGLREDDDTLPARWFDEPIMVKFPCAPPGAPEQCIIVDEPVAHIGELRQHLRLKLSEESGILDDPNFNIAIDGKMILAGGNQTDIPDGS